MPNRPRKTKTTKAKAVKPRHSVARPATTGRKSSKASRLRSTSRTRHGPEQASGKKPSRFDQFVAGLGLAELNDSNRLLLFAGDPSVPDALRALPRLRKEYKIHCDYRLGSPVPAPYDCWCVPEESQDVFPPRRTLTVVFGVAGKNYAYAHHEGSGHLTVLVICRRGDGPTLFRQWLETLISAQHSVNSSPMSPEYVSTDPDLYQDDFVPMLESALGLSLNERPGQ